MVISFCRGGAGGGEAGAVDMGSFASGVKIGKRHNLVENAGIVKRGMRFPLARIP